MCALQSTGDDNGFTYDCHGYNNVTRCALSEDEGLSNSSNVGKGSTVSVLAKIEEGSRNSSVAFVRSRRNM